MTRFNLCALMLLAFALLLGAPGAAQAAESYDNCTGYIASLPTAPHAACRRRSATGFLAEPRD